MRVTIYLTATHAMTQELREIRSQSTHSLLALAGKDGLYLWDRRSSSQHFWSWPSVMELYRQSICENTNEVECR